MDQHLVDLLIYILFCYAHTKLLLFIYYNYLLIDEIGTNSIVIAGSSMGTTGAIVSIGGVHLVHLQPVVVELLLNPMAPSPSRNLLIIIDYFFKERNRKYHIYKYTQSSTW